MNTPLPCGDPILRCTICCRRLGLQVCVRAKMYDMLPVSWVPSCRIQVRSLVDMLSFQSKTVAVSNCLPGFSQTLCLGFIVAVCLLGCLKVGCCLLLPVKGYKITNQFKVAGYCLFVFLAVVMSHARELCGDAVKRLLGHTFTWYCTLASSWRSKAIQCASVTRTV